MKTTATKKTAKRAAAPARAMACLDCGANLTSHREAHRFAMTGGWFVTVEDVEILRCTKCGYYEVVLEQAEALVKTVAAAVVRKASRLAAGEVAMLRAHLGVTGVELGRGLGVTQFAISRWENGKEKIGAVPERLLRALVMLRDGGEPAAFDVLSHLEDQGGEAPIKLTLRRAGAGAWEVAKAA
jgi:putative zinc finger/helix-turn-helix YgiT family protein